MSTFQMSEPPSTENLGFYLGSSSNIKGRKNMPRRAYVQPNAVPSHLSDANRP